jgi:hypothetical protein
VTGVSIGAVNAPAIAGARDGDINASLDRMWQAITLPTVPWLPESMQANLSLLANPNFRRSRTDYRQLASWDSVCRLLRLRALKNIHIIEGAVAAPGGDHDFSAYGVRKAYQAGRGGGAQCCPGHDAGSAAARGSGREARRSLMESRELAARCPGLRSLLQVHKPRTNVFTRCELRCTLRL